MVRPKRRVSADDALLDDLKSVWEDSNRNKPSYDYLRERGIRTYSQVYALAKRRDIDPTLHAHLVSLFWNLEHKLDRRKARPAMMNLAQTGEDIPRSMAVDRLCWYEGQQVTALLLQIAENQSENSDCRQAALRALESHRTIHPQTTEAFIRLVRDPTEVLFVRTQALECMPGHNGLIDLCIACLNDPSPDIRFWAAFRLSHEYQHENIRAAQADLARLVANDHAVPVGFGWHVDREALLPLETIYYQPYFSTEDRTDYSPIPDLRLISPAIEYGTFGMRKREWQEDGTYKTPEPEVITLRVDPAWLRERIREQWPEATFDVRQPRPVPYLLDWHLSMNGVDLLGALLNDGYGVVICGPPRRDSEWVLYEFAAWYRSVIDPAVPLYLYEWADEAIPLDVGVTATVLAEREDARYQECINMAGKLQ
ncbi:MAG: hypothetical protein J0M33_03655 [Anaerolineae bacterium]|nr:hypothetical protein [Anaerolineae bacterium]